MAKRKPVPAAKLANPLRYRAQHLRSSWLQRAKKMQAKGVDVTPADVPTREEIEEWLCGRFAAFARGEAACYYSSIMLQPLDDWQVDHYRPLQTARDFNLDNCVICSKQMNQAKGDLSAGAFSSILEIVEEFPEDGAKILKRLVMANNNFRPYIRK